MSTPSCDGKVREGAIGWRQPVKLAAGIGSVTAAVEEERITGAALVHLGHLSEKRAVITSVDFGIPRALELGQRSGKESAPILPFGISRFVPCSARRPGESVRQRLLRVGQDVHGKALRPLKVGESAGSLAKREKDQRRIERQRCERIHGHADVFSCLGAGRHDSHTRCKAPEYISQNARADWRHTDAYPFVACRSFAPCRS